MIKQTLMALAAIAMVLGVIALKPSLVCNGKYGKSNIGLHGCFTKSGKAKWFYPGQRYQIFGREYITYFKPSNFE